MPACARSRRSMDPGFRRGGETWIELNLREVVVDGADQALGQLLLVSTVAELPFLRRVRETAEFDQRRRNVRRLEHNEPRRTVRVVEQRHLAAEFRHQYLGKTLRHVVSLASREVVEDLADD